ncbi:hypothetical protein MMC14_000126 [Varicellaria rhodocarpa]|nr:hypothetical protein [Varicellaria rhodocarpa]
MTSLTSNADVMNDIVRTDANDPARNHDGDHGPGIKALLEDIHRKDKAKKVKSEGSKSRTSLGQKLWRQQLKRTQRYLGLCAIPDPLTESDGMNPSKIDGSLFTTPASKENSPLPNHDTPGTLPGTLNSRTMFLSVDVEAYEFDQKRITEIGISTLETVDLFEIPPGVNGKNWAAKVQSRHFRIQECAHLVNKKHVKGCPDKFEFGKSEFIPLKDVKSKLERCFLPSDSPLGLYSGGTCKVVLVAHNASADIKYLTELGFNVTEKISDCIDTSDLYKVVRRQAREVGLSTLMLRYGIPGDHLHNAGNDASYTLRALIAIAVDNFYIKTTKEDWEIEKNKRIEVAVKEAEAKVCADLEGWSSCEDDEIVASSAKPIVLDRHEEKASNKTGGKHRGDAPPNIERGFPRARGGHRTHFDGSLGGSAAHNVATLTSTYGQSSASLRSPSVKTGPPSFNNGPPSANVPYRLLYDGSNSENSGSGRGQRRRPRGGQAQGGIQGQVRGRGQGEGRGQGRGQAQGQV